MLDRPTVFASFEEMLASTAAAVPNRPVETLRLGVRHNARRLADGGWAWRWDPGRFGQPRLPEERELLWRELASIKVPVMLVRGERSGRVDDEDVAEFLRHQPRARIETVERAGHSVQGDRPDVMAMLIADFAHP